MHIRPINAVEVKLIIFIIMKTVLNKNVQRRPKNAKEQDTLRKQINECVSYTKREAQLSPSDRAMRLVSSNLAMQLPRNSAETTYTTSPDQTDGMKLEV